MTRAWPFRLLVLSPRHTRPPANVTVNKQALLDQITTVLSDELAVLTRAANDAFAAATDPDSKAENKYDTRTLEASYVARGQAQRVAELQEAVHTFQSMSSTPLPAGSAINLGTLVSLKTSEGTSHYFIAPCAGGTEVMQEEQEVYVITPASPLGQKLMGKRVGDGVPLRAGVMAEVVSAK